ncbi:MAG: hypothetical protein AB7I59_18985 [Geminicoccaceae bacterium]
MRRRGRRQRSGRLRLTATLRVAILAGAVSALKVILFALGSGAFLADHPAAALAWVYLALAVLAAGTAVAVLPRLEQSRPAAALAMLLLATAVTVPVAALALQVGLSWAPFTLLVLAHLYNVASEILLWLVAAAWLPAPELRRATLWICLAAALGGLCGGLGAERLLPLGMPLALTSGTLISVGCACLWLHRCRRTLGDGMSEPDDSGRMQAAGWGVVLRHPLAVPLGAGSFMLTFVWVLTEFVCLAGYQALGLEPAALAELLAIVYAVLQLVEFMAILALAGPATRWISPAWRSVLFPLGSLLSLIWMAREPSSLGPTMLAHAHTESVSNGLFDPVHASNFAAAPLRLQAKLRMLADGICYPFGMAAGGLALLLGGSDQSGASTLQPMLATTLAAASLFVAVGLLTGVMIAPSLLAGLGLTTEAAPHPPGAALRAARRALKPWMRRSRLRDRLLARCWHAADEATIRRRVDIADRRALRQAFHPARRCDPGGTIRQLEYLLDSRNDEARALAVEALLSLRMRRLFLPFLPALRRRC